MTAIKPGQEVSVLDTQGEIPCSPGRVLKTSGNGNVMILRLNEGTNRRQEFTGKDVSRFVLRPVNTAV